MKKVREFGRIKKPENLEIKNAREAGRMKKAWESGRMKSAIESEKVRESEIIKKPENREE